RHTRSKRDWSSDVCSSDLELLHVAPPRSHVGVAERPIDGDSLSRVGRVIEIAPPKDAASPHDGTSADLAPAYPVERFVLWKRIQIGRASCRERVESTVGGG